MKIFVSALICCYLLVGSLAAPAPEPAENEALEGLNMDDKDLAMLQQYDPSLGYVNSEWLRQKKSYAPAAPAYSAPAAPSYSAPAAPSYSAPASLTYSAPGPAIPCSKAIVVSCSPQIIPAPCSAPPAAGY